MCARSVWALIVLLTVLCSNHAVHGLGKRSGRGHRTRLRPSSCTSKHFLLDDDEVQKHLNNFYNSGDRNCEIVRRACTNPWGLVVYDQDRISDSAMGLRSYAFVKAAHISHSVAAVHSWSTGRAQKTDVWITDHYRHGKLQPTDEVYGTGHTLMWPTVRLASQDELDVMRQYEAAAARGSSTGVAGNSSAGTHKDGHPMFSQCVLPYVMYTNFPSNFAEFYVRSVVWTYFMQNGSLTPPLFDRNVTIVQATLGGLPLAQWQKNLLQPFTAHRPMSWAAFTMHGPQAGDEGARSRAGSQAGGSTAASHVSGTGRGAQRKMQADVAAGAGAGPRAASSRGGGGGDEPRVVDGGPLSHAGGSTQGPAKHCYERMLVCTFMGGSYPRMVEAASQISAYYSRAASSAGSIGAPSPAASVWQTLGQPGVLRVLFEDRAGLPMRQLLGLQELLSACNKMSDWVETLVGPGRLKLATRVECRSHTFGDLARDIPVVQAADVMLAPHGAGTVNAVFLRPGASFVELRAKGFGTQLRWLSDGWWPQICKFNAHRPFCWFLNIEADDAWTPGLWEARNDTTLPMDFHMRDRNIRFTLDDLMFILKKISAVGRTTNLYAPQFEAGHTSFTLHGKGVVTYSKDMPPSPPSPAAHPSMSAR